MSELDQRLARLEAELQALRDIKTQEDFDEGARLHALHNAPWVKGQYSHLEFPPYVHKEFPKAIYGVGYLKARQALQEAEMIPAFGMNDVERKQAILLAERELWKETRKVESEQELRRWLGTGQWFETPDDVEDYHKALQQAVETAAAHRAYEDRNMSDRARAEAEAYDDAAEEFVGEIPEKKKPGPRVQVLTESQLKAAAKAAAGGSEHAERKEAGGVVGRAHRSVGRVDGRSERPAGRGAGQRPAR
jgi:hypothetical protein